MLIPDMKKMRPIDPYETVYLSVNGVLKNRQTVISILPPFFPHQGRSMPTPPPAQCRVYAIARGETWQQQLPIAEQLADSAKE